MKKILLSIIVFVSIFFTTTIFAQNVGVNSTGATPNSSAMLDVSSTNTGILIPRVALLATNNASPVTSPATSLLVYNTATAGASPNNVTPGYYFWDGTKWVRFQDANAGNDWHIDGNAGTNPASNFIGTTDNQNFIIRTNNTERIRVESGGDVGVGTNTPDAKFHSHQSGTASGDIAIMATQNMNLSTSITAALFVAGGTDYDIYQYSGGRNALWAPTAIGHNNPSQMLDVNGNTRLRAHIYDSNNSAGNNGDILSRDAGGVIWVDSKCNDYAEGFEASFGIWSNVSGDDADWIRHSGGTSSASTGPPSANEGSQYIYCETSSPRIAGDIFNLQTNVRTCDAPSISFDYHMYFNTATDGTLLLEVSDDNGTTWTTLWTLTGNQGNVWHNDQTVSLATYANTFIILRFRFTIGSLGTSYQYDCALDDINLIDISEAYPSSGGSSGSGWEVLGNAGTNPTTNFIGTTDNQEFSIRTNNTEFFRITTKGQIETINTGSSVFIGVESGENDDLTANQNVFVGYHCGRANTSGNNNIALGDEALGDNTTGNYNTALGVNALADNVSGINNIALGNGASFNNLTGNYNIAHGAGALSYNTAGSYNVAVGYGAQNRNQSSGNVSAGRDAMRNVTTGCDYNVAIGYYAMRNGSDYINSEYNVAIGANSLESIDDDADYNVAIGASSLNNNTTGTDNTASGYNSLYSNTTGRYCTAIGSGALYSNTTGYSNTATGFNALYSNTGQYNTANGYHSLYYNTTGYNNTAVGRRSLYNNTTAYNNTAIGMQAMTQHQTGNSNFAAGYQAMYYSRTGNDYNIAIGDAMHGTANYINTDYNVALGHQSLNSINGGDHNIALGYQALYYKTTGSYNIGIGYYACRGGAASTQNVGVGRYALYQNLGSNNTGVGYAAGAGVSSPTYSYCTYLGYDADFGVTGTFSNAMALGYSATVTASNRVRVGNTSVTRIGGQVGWSTLSDGRVKENINEDIVGIDFIMKLRPITYTINKDKQDMILNKVDSSECVEKYDIEKIKFTGFIAQEVEQAATDCGYDFSGVKKPAHENDLYGLTYSEFVVPLVKATQEQQKIIEEQKVIIEQQQEEIKQQQQEQELQKQEIEEQQQEINKILQRLEELENN